MTADLVTDAPFHHITDLHRVLDATVTCVLSKPLKSEKTTESSRHRNIDDKKYNFTGFDGTKDRLVYLAARDGDEELTVKMSMLKRFPRLRVRTDLQDAHLYVFKRNVMDLFQEKPLCYSIQQDLLPLLVKSQYRPGLITWPSGSNVKIDVMNSLDLEKTSQFEDTLGYLDEEIKVQPDRVFCAAYVLDMGFCARANRIPAYTEINREIMRFKSIERISPHSDISGKTQVGPDSCVGEGTVIGDRCSVKKSCIGAHCVIGKNTKISNSIIMDHVILEDNCRLDHAIVCPKVRIQERSTLKDCEVMSGVILEKETVAKSEVLLP